MANRRVSKEREAFHTRVYDRIADVVIPFWPAIAAGVIVSFITIALGVVMTLPLLILIVCAYLLLVLTAQIRWMSPSFALGIVLTCSSI